MRCVDLNPQNPAHLSAITSIWNNACGADLAITQHLIDYNTQTPTGAMQAGCIAVRDAQPIGFTLASALPNDPPTSPPEIGWIDAVAVLPQFQKQGIGSDLLAWAQSWLREQGCTRARLGGSLRPFVPGYPTELNNVEYFSKREYALRVDSEHVWDVARDLHDFTPAPHTIDVTIRPAQAGDENAILEFFAREFSGRWWYEFQEFLRARGRLSDYLVLLTARGIDGFARLTLEDSEQPIERFYMHRLPKPWGQLGPIGVSRDSRGKGYGGALLDASLCYLRNQGVRGCVIDWTDLVAFYGKFGFTRCRKYAMLIKTLWNS